MIEEETNVRGTYTVERLLGEGAFAESATTRQASAATVRR